MPSQSERKWEGGGGLVSEQAMREADERRAGMVVSFTLSGKEPYGLIGVVRWLREGLHLLLMDGPTRRAVDKLYAALEEAMARGR